MYTTHGLWEQLEIRGTKLTVFQCRHVPDEEDLLVYGRKRFEANNDENVFYEVHISGSNKPFFSSKTEPTAEEIEFQLIEYNKSPVSNFLKSLFS
ncbi:hypothetical protein G8764_02660 [Pseudomaricurvus alcaniphilus]|uniref:hypothetical protein n=1 Tax=Pseudomaricurvus alcaniphilus TaxID=1166482 RepID=UPI001407E34F|nr:hypothetical protein [Pseudomaricurvus alcaniphilus]NHN36189.1 hypothetical protein [Pseudomaricurvus alcaniphilus]